MSPRGVAIPDVERQLFDAAERVLAREGPGGMSSRAIAREAGVATGLLFRHYADLDAFLGAFVGERFGRIHAAISGLPDRAGSGSIADNLAAAALTVGPTASLLIDLAHTRPAIAAHLVSAGHARQGGIEEIQRSFEAYLDAERTTGRIAADTDTAAIALALAASIHQIALTRRPGDPELPGQVRRVISALAAGLSPEGSD